MCFFQENFMHEECLSNNMNTLDYIFLNLREDAKAFAKPTKVIFKTKINKRENNTNLNLHEDVKNSQTSNFGYQYMAHLILKDGMRGFEYFLGNC